MKHISRRKNISRTNRRIKKYTKTAKRLARLKRRTRRITKNRRRSYTRHIRGGGEGDKVSATVVKDNNGAISIGVGGSVALLKTYGQMGGSADNKSIIAANKANNIQQAQQVNALKGGGGSYKRKHKQRGGNNNLSLYAYQPPPGMMGPVPQPSTDDTSNKLILQAANISVNGQANSEFDKNVNNVSK